MKIRPPSEDICLQCHVFKNQFKFNSKQAKAKIYDTDSDNEKEQDDRTVQMSNQVVTDEADVAENIILKAATHVRQTRSQRQLANLKIEQAKFTNDEVMAVMSQDQKVQTIIIDYCQNLNLPHLGEDQPGDAYYFSPMSIFCFGVCNAINNELTAYVYDESEGAKGGNNVASLVIDYVKTNFVHDDKAPMKELNIIMDNCAGQNKNRMVIRTAAYIMEAGMFSKVNLIFLIKGHTKNMCDRMFNTMKRNYARRNVYTKEETYRILDLEDSVEVVPAGGKFMDWDSEFDQIYKRPKSGTISKNHYFSFEYYHIDDMLLTTKVSYNSNITSTQKLVKIKKGWSVIDRQNYLATMKPSPLKKPGLSDQKQVHLYSKWRPLIPIEYQDISCPKPSDNVIERMKKDLKAKQELKEALLYDQSHINEPETRISQNAIRTKKKKKKDETNKKDDDLSEDFLLLTNDDEYVLTKKRAVVEKRLSGSSLVSCVQFLNDVEGLITQPPDPETINKDDKENLHI